MMPSFSPPGFVLIAPPEQTGYTTDFGEWLMSSDRGLDPSYFEGRYLVEIESWNWELGLGLMPASAPAEAKVHGELMYTRGVDIRGRVLVPRAYQPRTMGLWLTPSKLEYWSGPKARDDIGQLTFHEEPLNGMDLSASVLIPEDALSNVLTCLASIWRYVHLWNAGDFPQAILTMVTFSRDIPERLRPWLEDGVSGEH
jgi:hypothetical protein